MEFDIREKLVARLVRDIRKKYSDYSAWFSDFSAWCKKKRFTICKVEKLGQAEWWIRLGFCCYNYTVLVNTDSKNRLDFDIE